MLCSAMLEFSAVILNFLADMENVLGICQIRVKDLTFDKKLLRRARKKKHRKHAVSDMVEILRHGCDTIDYKNMLVVTVFSDELDSILKHSGYSLTDLTLTEPYLKLRPPRKLLCLHGRKRHEAATRIDPNMWWTVRLKCMPRGANPLCVFRGDVEEEAHQTEQSDGDIYMKMRYYRDDKEVMEMWFMKLSPCKRKGLKRLLGRDLTGTHLSGHALDLVNQLDDLLPYPGLWAGFEIGNIEKLLSLRSLPWIVNCLRRIGEVLNRIALNKAEIRDAFDENSIEELEGLAPFCAEDRENISYLMSTGTILPDIKSPGLRRKIEDSILQERCLLPSIKSLHENLKYLSIAITIIKRTLLDGLGKDESILAALGKLWQKPDSCIIEYDEGCFQKVPYAADLELTVLQIILAALRDFPDLSDFSPKYDHDESVDTGSKPAIKHRFLRGVQALGVSSAKIEAAAAEAAAAAAGARE